MSQSPGVHSRSAAQMRFHSCPKEMSPPHSCSPLVKWARVLLGVQVRAQRSLAPHAGSRIMIGAYCEDSLVTYCRWSICA